MSIFKMYMKIAYTKKKAILLYVGIFMAIFYVFAQSNMTDETLTSFETKEVSISIQDEDKSTLSNSFVAYLSDYANIVELEDSEEAVKDALFFYQIEYAITIPTDFEKQFFSDNPLDINTISRPNSASGMLLIQPINSYLSSVHTYHEVRPEMSVEEITKSVRNAYSEDTMVRLPKESEIDPRTQLMGIFFNFQSYIISLLIILIGGMVFIRVYDNEIRKRNKVSPVSNISFNIQIALASLCLAFGIWFVFIVFAEFLFKGFLTQKGLLYIVNSILLVLFSLGFTFMIVNILAGKKKQEDTLNGIANVYSLGSSFLCGVFIPQVMIGEGVLSIASFLPTFWFVKANDLLMNAKHFDFESMQEVYTCFTIELLFAIAFFVIATYISKTKANMKEL